MIRILSLTFCLLAVASAAETSPWHDLPPSTVFAVRCTDGGAWAEEFGDTRLAQVLLSEERLDRFWDVVTSADEEGEIDAFLGRLTAAGLQREDLDAMFAGECGFALSLLPGAGEPTADFLFWCEPEGDLAARLMTAASDAEEFQRSDHDLGDGLTVHEFRPQGAAEEDPGVLVHRDERRLYLMASTRARADAGWHAVIGAWIQGVHREAEDAPANRLAVTPGLEETLGREGSTTLLDAAFFPAPLLDALPVGELGTAHATGEEVIAATGARDLGPTAIRVSLAGEEMWGALLVSSPTPRRGLVRLLDQPTCAPEPPAWVPADVVSYGHFGIDVQHVYDVVTEFAVAIGGPQAQQNVEAFKMSMGLMLGGVQLDQILQALGERVAFIDFGDKVPEGGALAGNAPGMGAGMNTTRVGVVWDLVTDAPFKQMIPQFKNMFNNNPQAFVQFVEEQGIPGLRSAVPQIEGGLFFAPEHLVLGLGDGVVERLLKGIKEPGDGLAGSDLVARAKELLEPREGNGWGVQDGEKMMVTTAEAIRGQMQTLAAFQPEMAQVMPLIPTGEEMRGTMGRVVYQSWIDDQGFKMQEVMVLPRGEEVDSPGE